MVFKPVIHLARHTLAKGLPHGYAQSVVAASQSSYASSSTPLGALGNFSLGKFGKHGHAHVQSVFQSASGSSGSGAKAGHAGSGNGGSDGGLAAYYAAWQQAQQSAEDNEWKQYQFSKRIGWNAASDGKQVAEDGVASQEQEMSLRPHLVMVDRAYSANAVDDIKRVVDQAAEAEAVARVDKAIAAEIQLARTISLEPEVEDGLRKSPARSATPAHNVASPDDIQSPQLTIDSTAGGSLKSSATSLTPVSEAGAHSWSEQIVKLADSGQFAEIPAIFEAMRLEGHRPSVKAYNALLAAAMELPAEQHQVVPRVLDVYSDMVKQRVTPDTKTYVTLIQFLATKALDVLTLKRSLEQRRQRFGGLNEEGRFMLRSNEAEYDILMEDNSLSIAMQFFALATVVKRDLPVEMYHALVAACAKSKRLSDMIQVYTHMESLKVVPYAAMFIPMIEAFTAIGDLNSAVETYNGYKELAIADNNGTFSMIDRKDNEIYAATIKAYATCDKMEAGNRFLGRIFESYKEVGEGRDEQVRAMHETVISKALIERALETMQFDEAFRCLEAPVLSQDARDKALAKICIAAADHEDTSSALRAFNSLSLNNSVTESAVISMLAHFVRSGEMAQARPYWDILTASDSVTMDYLEPTTMYVLSSMASGRVEEGLGQARQMFARIRDSTNTSNAEAKAADKAKATEEIDEAIEALGNFLANKGLNISPASGMTLLWMMVENGGVLPSVADFVLARFGANEIFQLDQSNFGLLLRIQTGMLVNGTTSTDILHTSRFGLLLEHALSGAMRIDADMSKIIERGLSAVNSERPDLVQKWQLYLQSLIQPAYPSTPFAPAVRQGQPAAASYEDSFDPYGTSTDYKGSTVISDTLERTNGRSEHHLNEALAKFRNMRRAGRHPRYITYAKLITAAAKAERINLVHDIFGMARQDVPLVPQYAVVRYGWVSILDAMVGACLTLGNRTLAAQYHQELNDMGAAPTANTFGLYITTLKEGMKTFDEATEAVKIFHRAMSERVEPSSFLYNALIGKLGKARRIDDCLFYFAEMRNLGIRPTSVTYGTIVNALCRVSDEKFAEELFEEMETMPNYKPRPAPYNSLMQYFLTTKRDRSKVLAYYERMRSKNIQPTMHTYKLLIDTYATLEPVDMQAAESVLNQIKATGQRPEAVHYSSLIHAKGCVMHDMEGARKLFDTVLADSSVRPQPCLYQALFESMVANHQVNATEPILRSMAARRVEMTPYIANCLIHGWANEGNIAKSKSIYESIGMSKREPSTYEAMTRAFLSAEDRQSASTVVSEMLSRGYPAAVSGKIQELLGSTS